MTSARLIRRGDRHRRRRRLFADRKRTAQRSRVHLRTAALELLEDRCLLSTGTEWSNHPDYGAGRVILSESSPLTVSGHVGGNDTADYLQVAVDMGSTLEVKLHTFDEDVDLYLIEDTNNNGLRDRNETLDSSTRAGTLWEHVEWTAPRDTLYYVGVVPYQDADTYYKVTLQAGANASAPQPDLVSVTGIPSSVTAGQSFTVTVTAENDGGLGGPDSAINASVVYSDGSDDVEISLPNGISWANYRRNLSPGDLIWRKDAEKSSAASDHLVEAGDKNWQPGERHSMSFTVTPQKAGTLYVRTRVTMRYGVHPGNESTWFRNSTSAGGSHTTDQQGWGVAQFAVNVKPPVDAGDRPDYTATPLILSDQPGGVSARVGEWLGGSDRNDYFQVAVAANQRLTVRLTELTRNADLQLIDDSNGDGIFQQGEVVRKSVSTGTSDETFNITPARDSLFYIRVFTDSSPWMSYKLDVNGVNAARPSPDLLAVDLPSTVMAGEPFTVHVRATNGGGLGGPDSAINASVVYADGSHALTVSGPVNVGWADYSRSIEPGQHIWRKGPAQMTAVDHLVEAGDKNWQKNEGHAMRFTVTPQQPGTLYVRARATMREGVRFVGNDGQTFANDASAGVSQVTDQQGWTVAQYEITVRPPDDPYEQNDTLNSAYDLSAQAGKWLSDLAGVGIQRNDDWYKVAVPANERRVIVNCRFTHRDGDINLSLHDSNGRLLTRSAWSTDKEHIDYTVPTAGAYFLRVDHANRGNSYDLRWEHLPHETQANTTLTLLGDLKPGPEDSDPDDPIAIGSTTYFTANRTQLWKTDGTVPGTVMLKDVATENPTFFIEEMHQHKGTLVFTSVDGGDDKWTPYDDHHYRLWKSNGTTSGTVLVKDFGNDSKTSISAGAFFPRAGSPSDRLFLALDGADGHGVELWGSDLTESGTARITDVYPGPADGVVAPIAVWNGAVFFLGESDRNTYGLWKSDGTAGGTMRLTDNFAAPFPIRAINDTLFFTADDFQHGLELWKTDGTAGGTAMIKDINPGAGSGPAWGGMEAVGGVLYFPANDGQHGVELWRTDGTESGTIMVKDIYAGTKDSYPSGFFSLGDTLFFSADDEQHGGELWRTDGVAGGTMLVKDIRPGTESSWPWLLERAGGRLYFGADDGSHGNELWQTDGSADGTTMSADINPGLSGSYPVGSHSVNDVLFFRADDGQHGEEPFALHAPRTARDVGDILIDAADLGAVSQSSSAERTGIVGDGSEDFADVDMYRFSLATAATVQIDVTAYAGDGPPPASTLNSYLRLFDNQGQQLQFNDDYTERSANGTVTRTGSRITTQLAPGTYYAGVSGDPNRQYDARRIGQGTASHSTGDYTLKIVAAPSQPPSGDCVTVGQLCLTGSFESSGGRERSASGQVVINDLLSVSGSVSYDTATLDVWGNGAIYFGNLLVYHGKFEFPAGRRATEILNEALSGFKDIGLDIYVDQFTLLDNGVRVQGAVALPGVLGGAAIDFAGDHYIEVTSAGVNYNIHVTTNDILLNLDSLAFAARDLQLDVKKDGTSFVAQLSGLLDVDLAGAMVTVDLDAQRDHFFRFYVDQGVPHWTLVGEMEAHNIQIAPKTCTIEDLFIRADTQTNTYQFETNVKLKIGQQPVSIAGHLGILNGEFDNIGLVAENFDLLVWDKPPIYLDKAGGHLYHLARHDGIPTLIAVEAGLQLGPDIGDTNLVYLDLDGELDLGGTIAGSAALYLGNPKDAIAGGSVDVTWSPGRLFHLDGQLFVGQSADPLVQASGTLDLQDEVLRGALNGSLRTSALPDWLEELAGWWGVPNSFDISAYVQISDDGDNSNDFLMAGSEGLLTIKVDLVENFSWFDNIHLAKYRDLKAYLGGLLGAGESAPIRYELAGNLDSAVFQLQWAAGDPDIHLTSPDGTAYTPENVNDSPNDERFLRVDYSRFPIDRVATFLVRQPTAGIWQVDVINDAGEGTYTVSALQSTMSPTIDLLEPSVDQLGGRVEISWNDADPDSDARISLYYDDDRSGLDGSLIAEDISEDAAANHYTWDTSNVPTGQYYVYALIDDGDGLPDVSYSLGRISVMDPLAPPPVTGLHAAAVDDSSVRVAWDDSNATTVDRYLVSLTANAAGEHYERVITTRDPSVELHDLSAGETYRATVGVVDRDGRMSALADPVVAVVGGTPIVPPERGQWWVFATPGVVYKASVDGYEGDTFTARTLPDGATLTDDGVFVWNVPANAEGWYEVVVDVTNATGNTAVRRYMLLCDRQPPNLLAGQLEVGEISATSIAITLPAAHDVSGVPLYQWERNGVAGADWQIASTLVDGALDANTHHVYRARSRDASPSHRISEWTAPVDVWTLANVPDYPVAEAAPDAGLLLVSIPDDGNPVDTEYAIFNTTSGWYLAADGSNSDVPAWQPAAMWENTEVAGLAPDTDYGLAALARNGAGIQTSLGPTTIVHTSRETVPPSVTRIVQQSGRFTVHFSEPVAISRSDIQIVNSAGTPVDLAGAAFTYSSGESAVSLELAAAPDAGHYVLTVRGDTVQDLSANLLDGNADGTGGDDFAYEFDVTQVAPAVTLDADGSAGQGGGGFATSFTENGAPLALADDDAAITDSDSTHLTLLKVEIINPLDGAAETLSAAVIGTRIAADFRDAVLTLSGRDTVANYQQVLRSVTYGNTSENPNATDRLIRFTVDDGTNHSNSVATTLTIIPVNDPPVASPEEFSCDENGTLVASAPGVLANDHDVDSSNLHAMLVSPPKYGTLSLAENGSFTYVPQTNFNREDSFRYQVTDGSADGNVATVAITIDTQFPWHNGIMPLDVSGDGQIYPIDALLIINTLNEQGSRSLAQGRPHPLVAPFYDTSRSGMVAPIDALLVINHLNARGTGEGERYVDVIDSLSLGPRETNLRGTAIGLALSQLMDHPRQPAANQPESAGGNHLGVKPFVGGEPSYLLPVDPELLDPMSQAEWSSRDGDRWLTVEPGLLGILDGLSTALDEELLELLATATP